jgi:hypothetical protein
MSLRYQNNSKSMLSLNPQKSKGANCYYRRLQIHSQFDTKDIETQCISINTAYGNLIRVYEIWVI